MKNPFSSIKDGIKDAEKKREEEQTQRIERLRQLESGSTRNGLNRINPVKVLQDNKEKKAIKKEIEAYEKRKSDKKNLKITVAIIVGIVCILGVFSVFGGGTDKNKTNIPNTNTNVISTIDPKAEEEARKEAEAKAKAEEKARKEAEAKAKAEAEEKARKEAEAKARAEKEMKYRALVGKFSEAYSKKFKGSVEYFLFYKNEKVVLLYSTTKYGNQKVYRGTYSGNFESEITITFKDRTNQEVVLKRTGSGIEWEMTDFYGRPDNIAYERTSVSDAVKGLVNPELY